MFRRYFLDCRVYGIGGTVDLAHAAVTDFLQDFVMADLLADYGAIPPVLILLEIPQMIRLEGFEGKRSGLYRSMPSDRSGEF